MSEKKDKIEENVNNENKTEEQEKQTIEENNCEQMENGNEESVAEEAEKDPMQKMQEEFDALRDKYLRSVAEFDNYRKRTIKEKAELILNGGEKTPRLRRELDQAFVTAVAALGQYFQFGIFKRDDGDLGAGKNGIQRDEDHLQQDNEAYGFIHGKIRYSSFHLILLIV